MLTLSARLEALGTPSLAENVCPRWDSNCIPALENTGKSRKHRQSEPVPHHYDTDQPNPLLNHETQRREWILYPLWWRMPDASVGGRFRSGSLLAQNTRAPALPASGPAFEIV